MKPWLVLFCALALLLGAGPVQAQGLRATMGAARSGTAGAQPAPVARSGVGSQWGSGADAGGMPAGRPTQGFNSHVTVTQVFIPPAGVPMRPATASPSVQLAPPAQSSFPGHFFHHRGHFHNRPGIVIIEVPNFGGATVTQEFVSIGGWGGQLPFESYGTDSGVRAFGRLAPFDPAPDEIVRRMLALAAVKKGDVVYDLGAGDGRIVIAAAKKFGARAVGFEIDPGLVKLARENARKQGVEKLVEIRQQDLMSVDLSSATVVTLYLSREGNLALRSKLMRELKPGARVVSYAFDMAEWQPKIAESYRDAGGDSHMLYLWQMGEPLAFRTPER